MTTISDEMAEHLAQILDSHVKVRRHKAVSFLPIETIENIIG